MRRFPFYWVDAFTNTKMGGNPCAVVLGDDSLAAMEMQEIAKEINLSETAFIFSSQKADLRARYFTPQEELPFAGHPTICVAHVAITEGLLKANGDLCTQATLEVPAGLIPLEIEHSQPGRSKISMLQLKPKFLRTYNPLDILPIYGLSPEDLMPNVVIQTVSTGTAILMIPLRSFEVLKRIKYVDVDAYKKLKSGGDFLFPHHFVLQGMTTRGTTFARSLGTPPNSLEDSFTGSATGCMGAYLWKYRLISIPQFVAEQGHWMGRPGEAIVEAIGDPNDIQQVKVTGQAITLIKGHLEL